MTNVSPRPAFALMPGRPRRVENGFTLLELILVMVIIAVAMTIAFPSLGRFTAGRTLRNNAEKVLALADYARTQAMAEGRTHRLNIDTTNGIFWLTAENENGFDRLGREFGRDFALPETIAFAWLAAPERVEDSVFPGLSSAGSETVDTAGETADWIVFYPDGRTEACALRLADQRGNTADIVCTEPAIGFRLD